MSHHNNHNNHNNNKNKYNVNNKNNKLKNNIHSNNLNIYGNNSNDNNKLLSHNTQYSKYPLYRDIEIWSQRFPAWKLYEVRRSRLPLSIDNNEKWIDMTENRPSDFNSFIGDHNNDCMNTLKSIKDAFNDSRAFPSILMIVGPSGSGKSAITHAYMYELSSSIQLNTLEKRKKLYIWIDCAKYLNSKIDAHNVKITKEQDKNNNNNNNNKDKDINKFKPYDPKKLFNNENNNNNNNNNNRTETPKNTDDFNTLWQLLTRFLTTDLDKIVKINYRFIILDNADMIPPSQQQSLKRIMEEYVSSVKFILVVIDSNKIISSIQSKAVSVKTKAISETDALLVVLSTLYRNSIGYDRFGIKAIFKECEPHYSTSKLLNYCQDIFIQYQYISSEYIDTYTNKIKKKEINTLDVLKPLDRCDICTLIPPCKHYDEKILLENAIHRRRALPRYKGGMTCPEFLRFGYCSFFNENGHCSLDHPKNLHIIKDIINRCPSCSIPWPCGHCIFTPNREAIINLISDMKRRISLCKQLIAPDPPVALTKHIEIQFPNYKNNLTKLFKLYVTDGKENLLNEIQKWLDTEICVIADEYKSRENEITLGFGEFGKTPMLLDYSKKTTNQQSANDDDSSVLSLTSEIESVGGDSIS